MSIRSNFISKEEVFEKIKQIKIEFRLPYEFTIDISGEKKRNDNFGVIFWKIIESQIKTI